MKMLCTLGISIKNHKSSLATEYQETELETPQNIHILLILVQTLKRTTTPLERWTVCTKRNASRTERNVLGTKRKALRKERFAFLGTERCVRFGLVFNFPRYSDFLAWRICLLFIFSTQKENKFHLIRSSCSFVNFFDLKKDLSWWKLLILSINLNNFVYIAKIMISIWASSVLKIVT